MLNSSTIQHMNQAQSIAEKTKENDKFFDSSIHESILV